MLSENVKWRKDENSDPMLKMYDTLLIHYVLYVRQHLRAQVYIDDGQIFNS